MMISGIGVVTATTLVAVIGDVGRFPTLRHLVARRFITGIAATAGLDDDTTTHVLRHTFATRMARG